MSKSYFHGGANPLQNDPETSGQKRSFQEYERTLRSEAAMLPTPQLPSLHLLMGFGGGDAGEKTLVDNDLVTSAFAIDPNTKQPDTMSLQVLSEQPVVDPSALLRRPTRVSLDNDMQSNQDSRDDPESLSSPSDRKTNGDVDSGLSPSEVVLPCNVKISGGFAKAFNQPQTMCHEDDKLVADQWSTFAKTPPIEKEKALSRYYQGDSSDTDTNAWRPLPHNLDPDEEYSLLLIDSLWDYAFHNSSAVTINGIEFASASPSEKLDVILGQTITNWSRAQWESWSPKRNVAEMHYDELVAAFRRGKEFTYTGVARSATAMERLRDWRGMMPYPFGCRGAVRPYDLLLEGYSVTAQTKRLPATFGPEDKEPTRLTGGDLTKFLFEASNSAMVALHVSCTHKAWLTGNLVAVRNEYGFPWTGPHLLFVSLKQRGNDLVKDGDPEKMSETHQWKGYNGSTDLISAAKLAGIVRSIVSPRKTIDVIKNNVTWDELLGCHTNCDRTKGGQLPTGHVTKKQGELPVGVKAGSRNDNRSVVGVNDMSLGVCCSVFHVAPGTKEMNESNKSCWGNFAEVDVDVCANGGKPVLCVEIRDLCKCTVDTNANPGSYKCAKIQWSPRVIGGYQQSLVVSSSSLNNGAIKTEEKTEE